MANFNIASPESQNHCPSLGAHIICPHFDLYHFDFQLSLSHSAHRLPFLFAFPFCFSGISLLSVYWPSITCLLFWYVRAAAMLPCFYHLFILSSASPLLHCALVALLIYSCIFPTSLCCRVLHILV